MQAGYWAYGYNTFRVNITPFIQTGDNLLEVDLQNVEESSRWYPGAGIYRPVKLVLTKYGWIDPWKTYIRTRELSANLAVLDVNVGIGSALDGGLKFDVEICDATGKVVASGSSDDLNNEGIAQMAITVNQPQLWSPESPYLYTARIKYSQSGELLDEVTQKFGIRTIKCSKDGGFQLNGVSRKIKGVCLHHDLGPLGAAINKSALIRQIKMMKAMGCDAIRTSHNMPSQMQMDVCDSLGMMGVEFYSNAVLLAELEVTERHNHSMIVNYVSPSADAAIAESGGKNFRFVNNTEYPIYIEGYTSSDKHITFTIYGVETRDPGRKVAFKSEVLETTPASEDQYVTDGSQGIGYVGTQSAHIG